MTLTLLAVSLNDRPLSQPIAACFDDGGGTIGRAEHNTLVLPDPERHVSRLQAEIVAQAGGSFLVRNVGTANPIVVGDRVVGRSETALLEAGDQIRICGYVLQVANAEPAPAPAPPAAELPDPPPARTTAAGNADGLQADRAWAAFCGGFGVAVPPHPNGSEPGLREAGRLLRSAIEGALRLTAVRAGSAHELQAALPVTQPHETVPAADPALEGLLRPGANGFLGGTTAMDDAMRDLIGHSIATAAGMRAAASGLLERFAPAELEARLVQRSLLDRLLPGYRKSRLWNLYLQQHGAARSRAQQDFQMLFTRAFVAAYEQRTADAQRRPPAPAVR